MVLPPPPLLKEVKGVTVPPKQLKGKQQKLKRTRVDGLLLFVVDV